MVKRSLAIFAVNLAALFPTLTHAEELTHTYNDDGTELLNSVDNADDNMDEKGGGHGGGAGHSGGHGGSRGGHTGGNRGGGGGHGGGGHGGGGHGGGGHGGGGHGGGGHGGGGHGGGGHGGGGHGGGGHGGGGHGGGGHGGGGHGGGGHRGGGHRGGWGHGGVWRGRHGAGWGVGYSPGGYWGGVWYGTCYTNYFDASNAASQLWNDAKLIAEDPMADAGVRNAAYQLQNATYNLYQVVGSCTTTLLAYETVLSYFDQVADAYEYLVSFEQGNMSANVVDDFDNLARILQ